MADKPHGQQMGQKPPETTKPGEPKPTEPTPKPGEPKPSTPETPAPTAPASMLLTARQLLDYMLQDGTPKKVLAESEEWLKDNEGASAQALYYHMEAVGCDGAQGRPSVGTLRKACKFTFGADAEPDTIVEKSASDEIKRLRSENESLRKAVESANNQRAVTTRQLDNANAAKNELSRRVAILQGGKTPEELAALGLKD